MALQSRRLMCGSEEFPHTYLCNYRPKSSGSDGLSRSILHFKNGNQIHVDAWTDCAVQEFKKVPLEKNTTIIRALGHMEEMAEDTTSLDVIGQKLADSFQAQYIPTLLTKNQTPKLSRLKRLERAEALADQYSFTGNEFTEILIIDDIMTTGATMCAISAAVLSACPSCRITIFTLAATNSDSILNIELARQGLINVPLDPRPSMVQEDVPPYSEAAILRAKILADSFE